jgi:hypothetical protein
VAGIAVSRRLGVRLDVHLRGNPIFVGANCHIVFFDEGGVLGWRG